MPYSEDEWVPDITKTQDTPSPLPCPFCGGSARTVESASWRNLYIVFCESEECGVEIRGSVGEEAAIAMWNRRAVNREPAYAAMKEALAPFAKLASHYPEHVADYVQIGTNNLTVGDLRRAHAAHALAEGKQ